MSDLATRPDGGIKTLIASDKMREQFARALPSHLSADRFCRIAITAMTRTPKLLDCTPESVMKCLLDLSAMGLEPDGRRAHLIPYGREATLIVDYKGLVELIRRSGDVTGLRAETVCEADQFAWVNGEITHSVDWRQPRGPVQAVYAVATMKSGESQSATMTAEEVRAIQNRSRSGKNGPWVTDWSEMAKKTVVRRLSKMLPLSAEIMDHVTADDDISISPYVAKPVSMPVTAEFVPEAEALPEPEDIDAEAIPVDEGNIPPPQSREENVTGLRWPDLYPDGWREFRVPEFNNEPLGELSPSEIRRLRETETKCLDFAAALQASIVSEIDARLAAFGVHKSKFEQWLWDENRIGDTESLSDIDGSKLNRVLLDCKAFCKS